MVIASWNRDFLFSFKVIGYFNAYFVNDTDSDNIVHISNKPDSDNIVNKVYWLICVSARMNAFQRRVQPIDWSIQWPFMLCLYECIGLKFQEPQKPR